MASMSRPCSPPSTRSRVRRRLPNSSSVRPTNGSVAPTTAQLFKAFTAPDKRIRPARSRFSYDADHPPVLVGTNHGPTPVAFLLHAVAACITAGLANIAAARGITLRRVTSTVEGDIDLLGIFGPSDDVRNGYRQIRVHFDVDGDASPDQLRALGDQSRAVPRPT